MKQQFELVVVIPIGPDALPEFVTDNIHSIIHYTKSSFKIILADDSHKGTGSIVQQQFDGKLQIDIVPTPEPMGRMCGLYVNLCLAYKYAIQHYHFDALLKLDTDALIIGPAPEREAIALFKAQPSVGMAGQYPRQYDGAPWDISFPQKEITKITTTKRFFRKPIAHWILLRRYRKALKHGYKTGESVFGGSYFVSEAALIALDKVGLLPQYLLKKVYLEEDHLFSLLVKSVGMHLGDLASGSGPFGCAWRGLPASPEELYKKGKKIIHSTRFWEESKEAEIREFFREKRNAAMLVAR